MMRFFFIFSLSLFGVPLQCCLWLIVNINLLVVRDEGEFFVDVFKFLVNKSM